MRKATKKNFLHYWLMGASYVKGQIKVQVLERSVEFKTLKIELPDSKDTYWVKDGSLKRMN